MTEVVVAVDEAHRAVGAHPVEVDVEAEVVAWAQRAARKS